MFKGEKGITLVALVITIIVLLILAGVSISLVLSENGVLGKATNAVAENQKGTVLQDLKLGAADAGMAYYSAWATNQSVTKDTYYSNASYYKQNATIGTVSDTLTVASGFATGTYTVTNGGDTYNFKVDLSTGDVSIVE